MVLADCEPTLEIVSASLPALLKFGPSFYPQAGADAVGATRGFKIGATFRRNGGTMTFKALRVPVESCSRYRGLAAARPAPCYDRNPNLAGR
jgi:hypothetical protein